MLPSLKISSWSQESLSEFVSRITNITSKPLILIDGVGGSGKTSLSVKLAAILNANLVSSDDVAWCTDPLKWDDEMLAGIINPWLEGKNITYRPSGWIKENRPGFIEVGADKALIIEGSGVSRKTLRKYATYTIWVDTESEIARARVIQRDLANGENGGTLESVTEFTDWWDSVVDPFMLEEKPWEYADVIVNGFLSDNMYNNLMIHTP